MSVEKFIISKQSSSFTIASNKVINGLKSDLEILGLYMYLCSLPQNWHFYKTKLAEDCKVGIKKLNRMIKILSDCNLIEVIQNRTDDGRFSTFDMCIKNGEDFKIIYLTSIDDRKAKTVPTVSVPTVLTTYKRNIDKRNIEKEKDIYLGFDEFYKTYPLKKNPMAAKKAWAKGKCYEMAPSIIEDVRKRKEQETQWKDKRFIPHPSTYLNNKRWEDEIVTISPSTDKLSYSKQKEIRSTVPFFDDINHPQHESLMSFKRNMDVVGELF